MIEKNHLISLIINKTVFLLTLQLFTYRIGQAQTYKGAKVTSTNTDGLFTVLDADINNKILEQESADIHVEIEPEPTYLGEEIPIYANGSLTDDKQRN